MASATNHVDKEINWVFLAGQSTVKVLRYTWIYTKNQNLRGLDSKGVSLTTTI
jgi:hypothetical protein